MTELPQLDVYRPRYHFTAPAGWINDPNGLIQWNGKYHLFYQHYPFAPHWGPMHWGHAVSDDLVHWQHLPVALRPAPARVEGDMSGIFSGSAVDDNGVLTLVYTWFRDPKVHKGVPAEVQCIATSTDGINFAQYDDNPVVSVVPSAATAGFRDPKVWKDSDGLWKMALGSGHEGKGKVLLYSSPDLRTWTYLGVLCEGDGTNGAMWECPNLFPLGEKHVLLVSVNERGIKQGTRYMVGTFRDNRFYVETQGETDFGPDFYAAQVLTDAQGRVIMIGWMDRWGAQHPTEQDGWAGAMSLARELFLLPDGRLGSRPVAEVAGLRAGEPYRLENFVVVNGEDMPPQATGTSLEIAVEFEIEHATAREIGLEVRRSPLGDEKAVIRYDKVTGLLTLDRSRVGRGDGGCFSAPYVSQPGLTLKLRIFVDSSSVEVFTEDGQLAGSACIYPADRESVGVRLFASGGQVLVRSLKVWTLADAGING